MLKFSVGLYAKLVSKIGRLSHVASGRGMMMRTAVARAPATRKWENKGGDLCQQHLELTKIATPQDKERILGLTFTKKTLDSSFLKETLRLSSNTSKLTS